MKVEKEGDRIPEQDQSRKFYKDAIHKIYLCATGLGKGSRKDWSSKSEHCEKCQRQWDEITMSILEDN